MIHDVDELVITSGSYQHFEFKKNSLTWITKKKTAKICGTVIISCKNKKDQMCLLERGYFVLFDSICKVVPFYRPTKKK